MNPQPFVVNGGRTWQPVGRDLHTDLGNITNMLHCGPRLASKPANGCSFLSVERHHFGTNRSRTSLKCNRFFHNEPCILVSTPRRTGAAPMS